MFSKMVTPIVALGVLFSGALAQGPPCTGTPLQCDVCGAPNSSGIECTAFNGTFDDLTLHSTVSSYDTISWTGFTVVNHGTANPIVAASKPHLARSTSGKGVMDFSGGGGGLGGLVNFSYACADPCTPKSSDRAVACNLTIVANCAEAGPQSEELFSYNGTFLYTPTTTKKATMAAGDWTAVEEAFSQPSGSPYDDLPNFCANYSFEATQSDGKPAFLYLDDVVFLTWTFENF